MVKRLLEAGRRRMLVHRITMLKTTEKIAERENLSGVVTGESLGQKSSQSASNLEITSKEVDMPVYRPEEFRKLKNEVGLEELVETAYGSYGTFEIG